jgi:hypothetical protein
MKTNSQGQHSQTGYRFILGVILTLAFCLVLTFGLQSCSSTKIVPANAITLTGKMNPVLGGKELNKSACWALESSGDDLRTLRYYQLIGDAELIEKLREEDALVTVRVVLKPELKTECPVGTVAELYEIVSMRSKRD